MNQRRVKKARMGVGRGWKAKCESLLLLAPPKLSVQEKVSTFKKCINDTTNRKSKKTKSFSEKLK